MGNSAVQCGIFDIESDIGHHFLLTSYNTLWNRPTIHNKKEPSIFDIKNILETKIPRSTSDLYFFNCSGIVILFALFLKPFRELVGPASYIIARPSYIIAKLLYVIAKLTYLIARLSYIIARLHLKATIDFCQTPVQGWE